MGGTGLRDSKDCSSGIISRTGKTRLYIKHGYERKKPPLKLCNRVVSGFSVKARLIRLILKGDYVSSGCFQVLSGRISGLT